MPDWFVESATGRHLVASALLILLIIVGRWLALRHVTRSTDHSENLRRRWIVQIRNAAVLIALLGLLIIWAQELRTVALSAIAVAAAIVIATKELIMCLSGTILEGSANTFQIGDRIEVDGLRGDVFDQTLLTTTILEIGPGQQTHQFTGRKVVIPNSVFLAKPVFNETATDEYVLHIFAVPVKTEDDWRSAEARLLEAAKRECAPYLDDARRHMEHIGKEQGIRSLSVEPRVTIQLPEPGRINLIVRIPTPARHRGRVEQSILRAVAPTLVSAAKAEG
ncbi:MAG: mechanosensitive ion channel domain-containing protein [Phycisphaerales bacterium]